MPTRFFVLRFALFESALSFAPLLRLPILRLVEGEAVFGVQDRPACGGDFPAQLIGFGEIFRFLRLPTLLRQLFYLFGS